MASTFKIEYVSGPVPSFYSQNSTQVESLVGTGGVPVFAFYLQSSRRRSFGGVNGVHNTKVFAYTSLENTSFWC